MPRPLPNLRLYAPARALTISVPAFTRTLFEAALIALAYLGAQRIEAAHQAGLLPVLAVVYRSGPALALRRCATART